MKNTKRGKSMGDPWNWEADTKTNIEVNTGEPKPVLYTADDKPLYRRIGFVKGGK